MKTGTELILAERERQIRVKRWDAKHDDQHSNHELQRAAESYFLSAGMTLQGFKSFRPPDGWPWAKEWWKPSTPIRDLTKAGALWLAEVDRLRRLQTPFTTILKNLGNRVEQCARRIDDLTGHKKPKSEIVNRKS